MTKYNKVNFAIALLIAICLWVYVLIVQNPYSNHTMKNVPVNYLNEDTLEANGLVVIDKEMEAVTVSYSGQRSDTDTVKAGDFKVSADLEGLKVGENTVRLLVTGPQSVKVDGTNPQKVKVIIDELVSEEKNISVRLVNQVSDESEPHIVQVSHESVNVIGARSYVEEVAYVKAEVDAGKVGNNLKALNIKLVPVDSEGDIVENVQLEFESISVTTILHNKKTVSLTVPVTGDDDIYITRIINVPKIITIKGTDDNLDLITSITCEPVDVSSVFEDTMLAVTPILPEEIEVAMNSDNLKVEVIAVDASSKEFVFTENDIVFEGVTEGLLPLINDMEIQVKVSGRTSVVDAASVLDFNLSADVSGLETGEHVLALNCICANNLLAVEYNPKEITIVIEDKNAEEPVPEDSQQETQPDTEEPDSEDQETVDGSQGEGEV